MSLSSIGLVVLRLVAFLACLVNFQSALAFVEHPMLLVGVYYASETLTRSADRTLNEEVARPQAIQQLLQLYYFIMSSTSDSHQQVDHEIAENGYRTPKENFFSGRPISPNSNVMMMHRHHSHARSHVDDMLGAAAPPLQQFNSESLARMISLARKESRGKIGIRDRICCYQWTWFTMTMATGGIANVLYSLSVAYSATWVWYIGLVFFLLNLTLFVINSVLITMRFVMVPGSFMHSFLDQMESLFIPAVVRDHALVVSIATILVNICQFGIPHTGSWLLRIMQAFFWIYVICSVVTSAGMYLILWSTQIFPIHTMTPVWVFPGYPLLLVAPLAANLISVDTTSPGGPKLDRLAIAATAVTVQGTGFLLSFMICAAFIYRLMTQKLPRDFQRPGVFISIGPPAFTVAGLVELGQLAQTILPSTYPGEPHAVIILELVSILIGMWLWGMSVWFFIVSVGSLWKYTRRDHKMPFQMTWWSFVFPNTALTTATMALARALDSTGLHIFTIVETAVLVAVWALVFCTMVKGLWKRELLWPRDLEKPMA
ncbi:voltage-dependent anion channel-domain-containing protein [Xylariaceae sp. FL0255]|nr:voltage-dependent anion channel-domain-containing protein [Xylariaceae sp. FL0255]